MPYSLETFSLEWLSIFLTKHVLRCRPSVRDKALGGKRRHICMNELKLAEVEFSNKNIWSKQKFSD